jgi:hypothetical protein
MPAKKEYTAEFKEQAVRFVLEEIEPDESRNHQQHHNTGGSTVAAGESFTGVIPARVIETRADGVTVDGRQQRVGRRSAGQVTEVQIGGRAGVPTNAVAAVINVTAINPAQPGFVTVYPCGTNRPDASTLEGFEAAFRISSRQLLRVVLRPLLCIPSTETPSLRNQHVWLMPAAREVNVPAGGVAFPQKLSPVAVAIGTDTVLETGVFAFWMRAWLEGS